MPRVAAVLFRKNVYCIFRYWKTYRMHSSYVFVPTAPLSAALSNRFGERKVVAFGGLLVFLGLIISVFATSHYYLYASLGVVAGKIVMRVYKYTTSRFLLSSSLLPVCRHLNVSNCEKRSVKLGQL